MPFRDECGVFGISPAAEASRQTYLGLYALQHRGQEAAGICSRHEGKLFLHKDQGYVADIFDEATLDSLPGDAAIGGFSNAAGINVASASSGHQSLNQQAVSLGIVGTVNLNGTGGGQ